jgi:hypothetical protein
MEYFQLFGNIPYTNMNLSTRTVDAQSWPVPLNDNVAKRLIPKWQNIPTLTGHQVVFLAKTVYRSQT